ncbi:hypothetical protein OG2516_15374 [Oceanicola granulosus HTCC2516]|uniref:Nudix hydrolase domain-containing protein n=1 Tax=Oceanicola granulosus (strain ATCC BAA-861 / DSM 15982 / KCTC 12143 / HTCC2516) TaxID=314256 RepID=Q2CFD8_OCEGH|nr:NUDIX hydrolase [Oceanicola granulosus]EAR51357.1 hypothetical protein OG2516_15374 [Oceanicola granulosus HTCC2516]
MTVSVRDAATLILVREDGPEPAVLMGMRGGRAAFMPGKMVFPGGAVDPGDAGIPLAALPGRDCLARLSQDSALPPEALCAAAIRELWEETRQILGRPAPWPDAPPGWRGFAATGHRPDAAALSYVFRAITPPGNTRRFDARFFAAPASALVSDPDALSAVEGELSGLRWVPLSQARTLDLPFITRVVLAEVAVHGRRPAGPVPFFRHGQEESHFARLAGRDPLDL